MAIQSEVQYTAVSASTLGNNTLVAAAGSGIAIRVVSLVLCASGGANTLKLQSDAGGTDLTGVIALAATTGQLVLPYNPAGWCQTASNKLLNMVLTAGTAVSGVLGYVTVS